MEGQRGWGGMLPSVRFHLAEPGRDGRACSAGRKDSGHLGMLTEMHQGVGGQSDRSVPESARYRIRVQFHLFTERPWATSTGMFGYFISERVNNNQPDRRWILHQPLKISEMVRAHVTDVCVIRAICILYYLSLRAMIHLSM